MDLDATERPHCGRGSGYGQPWVAGSNGRLRLRWGLREPSRTTLIFRVARSLNTEPYSRRSLVPGFFIGLGSNLEPQRHIGCAIERLAHLAGGIDVSRVIATAPVNLATSNSFFNAVAYITCELDGSRLKTHLNRIE